MDTPPEEDFDRLARLASRLFHVPIVLVSLLERDRQFFKTHVGIDVCETSREVSFCAHAIVGDDIFLVPDATKDPRFSSNPLVIGPPFIRFYAGQPLASPTGEKLGTVCLIDTQPRGIFTAEDRKNLTDLAALVMDRMEIRRLEYVRSASQARFENIAATSPDAIICSDSEGLITFWNKSAERLFGYSAKEVLGRSSGVIVPASWRRIYESERDHLRKGEQMELANQTIELSGLRKDGSEFPAEFSLSTWKEGNTTSVGAIVRDITERRQNEERLFRLAAIDALTDLPNRAAWRAQLEQTMAAEQPATVLLIDLDGFKEVNDTLGHSAGDSVLRDVASRLTSVCEMATMAARLGGDEFVALMPGNDLWQATAIADELVRSLSQPYEFVGQNCDVGVSVGVALGPQHGKHPEELLSAADLALYRAKATGKGRYELFEPKLRERAVARREFERELRLAFENGEFELFYQPQISTGDRRLTGAEALIRWNHPERGLLTPVSFITVLSQKPSAAAIGDWILRTACRQASDWRKVIPDFRIGVNLFEAQFRSGRLLTAVRETMEENDLPAEAIELEIVENILLHDDSGPLKVLQELRKLGVGLAFDDYGTGFASLSLLKRYPVSRLKIDRSFVRDVNSDPEDAAVVNAILYLGRSFGLDVIAEGVETEAQLDFLRKNRCQEAQGYLFGKPVPAREFENKFILETITAF
ncbi:diguanylate cyclase (GGDEF)-like protein/PAS domain S-box-containing protein [Rhodobium orientis]|uniref:Bifunctional diguanylate cyclase/phosphodiesterase n=1 Tax=Rhodobium orientis TaxID=34017 RepID=A0A327JMH4_9HYPH|nr:EAL domain-containing protein [Rhodobium orientis]MBB4303129.1 diguanylate cyclase (GGDEF)-like protein/PAS domain S-box-containing protein [Rhodobium orientis]MBK5951767.1 bifunctional diguanylate cyclase/phosphodiesterase [Rhodobium orientis]RAI26945.1 bifunctional diguanylate cyclase/phosphodiesterase [Rhodobium orientis]